MSSGSGQVGPYAIRGILGRGGSAIVYRGYDPALGREVAIKALALKHEQEAVQRKRFQRELHAVAHLRHPNIITVYSAGEEYGTPYLVMELFPGGTLVSRLGQPLPLPEVASILRQIGSALDFAHAQGILHRDVKPANIFIDGDRAVLADFGIIKSLTGDDRTNLTLTGLAVGTPEYIAPEQALGEVLDGRADLYALGIILYEMLTGTQPFLGGPFEVLNGHVEGNVPDPRQHNPHLPPAVVTVLLKALARYPEGRYPSGAALADAFDQALRQDTTAANTYESEASRAERTQIINHPPEHLANTQEGLVPALPSLSDTSMLQTPPPQKLMTDTALPILPDLSANQTTASKPATTGTEATIVNQPPPGNAGQRLGATLTPQPGPVAAIPMPQPNGIAATPPAQQRRLFWVLLSLGLVLLVALGAGGVLTLRQRFAAATPTASAAAQPTNTGVIGVAGTSTTPVGMIGTATVASQPSGTPTTLVASGDQALQNGRFAEAVANYRAALQADPNNAIANRQLGLTLWIWYHEPGDLTYLDRATKQAPNDALAWAYLSFAAVDQHQVERAYAAAQQAVRVNQQQAEAYAALANAYLHYPPDTNDPQANLQTVEEAVKKAQQLDPQNLWTLWVSSALLQAREQYQAALQPLEQMSQQRPNWPILKSARGSIYRALEQPDEARRWQEQALVLDPDSPNALTELGWLSYDAKQYTQARTQFERALQLSGETNDDAHVGLGWTLAAVADYTRAVSECQRAIQIESRGPLGYACLGDALLDGPHEYGNAQTNFRKVIELRPTWETGYIGVARVAIAQQDYAAAEAILRQGLSRSTAPRAINFWLGVSLYHQQQYERAQLEFERAANLQPKDPVVHFWLGSTFEELGRYPQARAAYERALTLDPAYQQAREALDRLTRQGH